MIGRFLALFRRTAPNPLAQVVAEHEPIAVDDEALERYRRYHSSNQFGR